MNYDLTNPLHRKQFVRRANKMLERKCQNAVLTDESKRSLSQNSYLHVLCRILAIETGVTERYAKDMYFKTMSNPDIFIRDDEDKLTGMRVQYLRSTSTLTTDEMSKAINSFRHWSEDQGYYLPEADLDASGNMVFTSEKDKEAFRQGEIEASRMESFI